MTLMVLKNMVCRIVRPESMRERVVPTVSSKKASVRVL